jgi:hypothetical protein
MINPVVAKLCQVGSIRATRDKIHLPIKCPMNKSDLHIIIEILLKGALSAISPKSYPNVGFPVPKII